MTDSPFDRIGQLLRRGRSWYALPQLPAMARLIDIRNRLRRENLYDTEEPPVLAASRDSAGRTLPDGRSTDGSGNDREDPSMGAATRRFGRNVPLEHTWPDTARLLEPSPRLVSRELMTRETFRPATGLNLLAAAWIQFMVHDWFVHQRSPLESGLDLPLVSGDDWPVATMRIPRTVPDPAPPGSTRPAAYANNSSHWWDASQIYGSDSVTAAALRTGEGGRLRLNAAGTCLPVVPETGIHLSGFTDNWWVGLAMLHTLFVREHNYLCDELAQEYPAWSDAQTFRTARLINAAVMAKIHTVEWTPAILPHPVIGVAMRTNWSGLAGDELQDLFAVLNDSELLGGIVGSRHNHHGVPYALTEEFVSVYRMHPLMPDTITLRRLADDEVVVCLELPEMAGRLTCGVTDRMAMSDLFYSFGRAHPGAVTLHNYPRHLQNLTRDNGEHFDLAAVDIYRDRERGVPRYNEFRRLFHKPPLSSIDELTDDAPWREQIGRVYDHDIERVDLMTGLYAEPLPAGFGFSETAFRVFVLMASRRLQSDRFFTDDYREPLYTAFGLHHIRSTSMHTLLTRHHPELAAPLLGVSNAFAPWQPTGIRGPERSST
jgi:Animal haem peroxidase